MDFLEILMVIGSYMLIRGLLWTFFGLEIEPVSYMVSGMIVMALALLFKFVSRASNNG